MVKPDPGGGYTIGIGHHMKTKVTQEGYRLAMNEPNYNGGSTLLPSDLEQISDAAVNRILDDDVDLGADEAREFLLSPSLWSGLGDVRRDVLVQMAFQMGLNRLNGFVKFRQALQNRDYDKAAKEMLDSKWAREDSPARARRMADAMKSNSAASFWQAEDPFSGG